VFDSQRLLFGNPSVDLWSNTGSLGRKAPVSTFCRIIRPPSCAGIREPPPDLVRRLGKGRPLGGGLLFCWPRIICVRSSNVDDGSDLRNLRRRVAPQNSIAPLEWNLGPRRSSRRHHISGRRLVRAGHARSASAVQCLRWSGTPRPPRARGQHALQRFASTTRSPVPGQSGRSSRDR
jgi:hypothetical protein